MEIPSFMYKRSMYEKFCYGRGWIAKKDHVGHYGRISNFELRDNDDDIGDLDDWPSGSHPLPIRRWGTFHGIWSKHCPLVKVRPKFRDIFTDCLVFKTMSTFISTKERRDEEWLDSDS